MSDGNDQPGLIDRAAELLSTQMSVQPGDDSSVTAYFQGTVVSMRALALAPGLDVLSLTQVLAWDLPVTDQLREDVTAAADASNFGTVKLAVHEVTADVLLHYTFPAGTLSDDALRTMLMMVLGSGADVGVTIRG
ncbi:hypothetical protein [Nocardia sp. 348MFTsu5.1]|uniref:hypothetical protein n=1 Tax=Nocardia sp. 348MFTsu5.1 TaxID=1172185 RepID=UPI00037419C6|nr:hypothetical protein [Nocardia sp. 348MFTsu5.1]